MDTAAAPAPVMETEADRLLARRQAILACSQSLWDRANALEERTEPPQDAYTEGAEDFDHGDPTKARYYAEDYDTNTEGSREALFGHIEETGQLPAAWHKPLPTGATIDETDRYAASLAPPEGEHVIARQFTVTMRLHQGRWVIDPGCLPGDGLDFDGVAEHAHDCPCGDHGGYTARDAVDSAQSLPAPTPGQLADSIRRAYEIATTPTTS